MRESDRERERRKGKEKSKFIVPFHATARELTVAMGFELQRRFDDVAYLSASGVPPLALAEKMVLPRHRT